MSVLLLQNKFITQLFLVPFGIDKASGTCYDSKNCSFVGLWTETPVEDLLLARPHFLIEMPLLVLSTLRINSQLDLRKANMEAIIKDNGRAGSECPLLIWHCVSKHCRPQKSCSVD